MRRSQRITARLDVFPSNDHSRAWAASRYNQEWTSMHEASIVESLLDLVVQNTTGSARVRRVDVRVGLLTGVSPDSLQLYFEFLREGTVCDGAEMAVTLQPLLAHCENCGTDHTLREVDWVCPACGQGALTFRNGDELHLESIEVDNGEGIHAGAADSQAQQ